MTDDDWYPPVTGVDDGRLPALVPAGLSDGLPTYQFVADALSVDRSDTGEWTALSVGPYAFAVPGIHEGRVEGGGVLRYDTHMIEGDEVLSAIGRRLEVVRVQRLRRGYLRQPDGTMLALPHEPAADVASTRQVRPAQRFGENVTFLIYLTPTTGLRPA